MNSFQRKKIAAVTIGLATTGGLAYASCGGTEPMVTIEVEALVATVLNKIVDGFTSMNYFSAYFSNGTVSAIKVATKQESVSAEKKRLAMRNSGAAFATAYVAQRSSEQVYSVYSRYRSQGFDSCGVSGMTTALRTREVAVDGSIATRIGAEIEAAPGRFGDPAQALKVRLDEHKAKFCTATEQAAGVCSSVGVLPGGDSNAALLFEEASPNDNTSKAKNAFINNLFGLPHSAQGFAGRGQTPEGQSALVDKHRRDAVNSIAMVSFKTIQAEHEKDSATGSSLAGLIRQRVSTYFGSDRSQQWAQTLAAQEQRGVLVDMVRMEGIALKMAERRVRQNARIEANMAGLLAVTNDAYNGR